MGRGSKKRRNQQVASTSSGPATAEDAADASGRREIRPYVYAGFDALMLIVWVVILTEIMPNRHGWAGVLLWSMVLSFAVMGGAMLVRNRWGWRAGAAACGLLIGLWIVTVVILLMSAAFLAGVYGGFGQAVALGTVVAVLLTLQLVALVPVLQLKFLMTRAGRRHFGEKPFWS
ncbi:MAG TPA: hypothetical protein VML75_10165 [Kofleriaceae bacterium]|nr:hypothetical protein [Kofleriaceae bacterium]